MAELLIVAVAVLGFAMVSWFDLDLEGETVSILVEATLVLVLFSDAIGIDLKVSRRQAAIPGRSLSIGLPLTILTGTGVALLVVPDLGWSKQSCWRRCWPKRSRGFTSSLPSSPRCRRIRIRMAERLNAEKEPMPEMEPAAEIPTRRSLDMQPPAAGSTPTTERSQR